MKCENCNERNATFFLEQIINGEKRSHRLCRACAEQLGLFHPGKNAIEDVFSPLLGSHTAMIDEIFGFAGQGVKAKKCEGCGATWQELSKSGRVGCPRCYATFEAELESSIRGIHGNVTHVGTGPVKKRVSTGPVKKRVCTTREDLLEDLKKLMREAIESENFEEAARLRDKIRAESDKKGG